MDVVTFLSILTLLSNIFLIVMVVALGFKFLLKNARLWDKISAFISDWLILLSFIVATTATIGSLYFSEGLGYTPCMLCWFQRIFMYPLSIILFVAYRIKDTDVWKYVLPLSSIGLLIAGYHYYLQRAANPFAPCSTIGYAVSCTDKFFMEFGYITIPWMALSAFALITLFMLMLKSGK